MKECTKCKKTKQLNYFYKSKNHKSGYVYNCKSCMIKATQDWRDIHWKEQRELKEKRRKDKEIEKIKRKKQFIFNKKVLLPFKKQMRARIHYALDKRNKKKNKRVYLYEILLGCSYSDLIIHIEKQFIKGMTWENKGVWETDHIIPLSSANTIEELYVLFHYTNIQPLWNYKNLKKSAKIPLVSNLYLHNNDINKRIEYIKLQHKVHQDKYKNYRGIRKKPISLLQ